MAGRPDSERATRTRMPRHAGPREPGDVGIGQAPRIVEALGETRQSRPENQADDGALGSDVCADRSRRIGGSAPSPATGHDSAHDLPPRSAAISALACVSSVARSSAERNALSKPLSAIVDSSSNEKSRWRAAWAYSSVKVVPLMSRLSVFNTTLSPASKYRRSGCVS